MHSRKGGIIILDRAVPDSSSSAETFIGHSSESDILNEIRTLAGGLRKRNGSAPENLDFTVPVGWEERIGHLDDQPIRRLIIFLRSTGCEWVEKTGGCTMCGFYCATSRGREVSADEYVAQFEHVMDAVDLGDYPIVSIYNDGNIFNEREMPVAAVVWRKGWDSSSKEDALRAYAKERLAGYKVPRKIITVDALPRVNGWKLLRRELREQYS